MDNLSAYGHPRQSGFVTTWTVTATSESDGDDIVCTKAAEPGRSHFVTFIACSTNNTDATGDIKAKLWDGVVPESGTDGLRLEAWPIEQDGTPSILNFSSPIQMTAGTILNLEGEVSAGDKASFTVGGFTSNVRID